MNRTKDEIVKAFGDLLTERPLSKITVKDVVDRCGINRNTFYYHFESIPSLLEQTVKYMTDEIIPNSAHRWTVLLPLFNTAPATKKPFCISTVPSSAKCF